MLQALSSVVCKQTGPGDMGQPAGGEGSLVQGVMSDVGTKRSREGMSACRKIKASCGLKSLKKV